LGRIAAVAVAPAHQFQFKGQVSHSLAFCFSPIWLSVAPGYPLVVAGV
jgi:hypothetical protein